MADNYLTIVESHQAEIKVERSRFITTAIPANSRNVAEEQYRLIVKKYHDATHNCFAFRIGTDSQEQYRYSDDGEPSGTAGRPIYDTILSFSVTDLLVVVTRYFGGIKLGTGGLARAYRDAARTALTEAKIIKRWITQQLVIKFDHDQTSVIMKILSDFDLKPIRTGYTEQVEIHCAIRVSLVDKFCRIVIERTHGKATVEEI